MAGKPETGDLLTDYFGRSVAALELAAESREFMSSVAAIALAIETSLRACGKLIIAGNGGNAADAQHLAAEFLSRFLVERRPFACACFDYGHIGVDRDRQRLRL